MLLSPYVPNLRLSDPPVSTSSGSGSPEGVIVGSPPKLYLDTDTDELYFKASGDSTDTGWVLVSGSGAVTQGSGAPTSPPAHPETPAVYTNLDDGVLYTWNVLTQAWI